MAYKTHKKIKASPNCSKSAKSTGEGEGKDLWTFLVFYQVSLQETIPPSRLWVGRRCACLAGCPVADGQLRTAANKDTALKSYGKSC